MNGLFIMILGTNIIIYKIFVTAIAQTGLLVISIIM